MTDDRLAAALARSRFAGAARTALAVLDRAVTHSRLADAARSLDAWLADAARSLDGWLASAVAGSRLVAWLTAEPDPEVVVVDLRETWTGGPILAILDRLAAGAAGRLATALDRRLEAALDAPVRLLGVPLLAVGTRLVVDGTGVAGLLVFLAGALALFEARSPAALRETATGRVLRALFAPPEPSNGDRER